MNLLLWLIALSGVSAVAEASLGDPRKKVRTSNAVAVLSAVGGR